MKAYQIIIKGNEISEAYAEMSRKSFEPAIEAGIISEIITFDAITPESPDFEEHCARYNWQVSLMNADRGQPEADHSPTEKAGMCSHWELMRLQGQSEERFFVMEHDTFLREGMVDVLKEMIDYTRDYDILYSNLGLFMGMYSFKPDVARWQYDVMVDKGFPINCGPYCCLMRLFRTFLSDNVHGKLHEYHPYAHKKRLAIHPWAETLTLSVCDDISVPFNVNDPDPKNSVPNPTTQIISKSMSVTQDHHRYKAKHVDEPWTRWPHFKVVD